MLAFTHTIVTTMSITRFSPTILVFLGFASISVSGFAPGSSSGPTPELQSVAPATPRARDTDAMGSIQGIVITSQGQPMPNVLVAARLEGVDPDLYPLQASINTGADGKYRLDVPPGAYCVSANPMYIGATVNDGVRVGAGETRKDVDLVITGLEGQVFVANGTVKHVNGNYIPMTQVHFVREDGVVFHAATNPAGYYILALPGGKYRAFASAPGLRSTPVDIDPAKATVDLTLGTAPDPFIPAPAEVVEALEKHAIKLATVEAGHGFEDLVPLKEIVGSARVVSLGEATQGTREFSEVKHRLLEFLVSEVGFSVFGIEAAFPESLDVGEYVLHGTGDPKELLANLHSWSSNTEELLDLVQWMRAWNAGEKHANKVKFYGFDMQYTPVAARRVQEYLEKVEPDSALRAGQLLAPFRQVDDEQRPRYGSLSAEMRAATKAGIEDMLATMNDAKDDYVRKTSEAEWALALQQARIISQCEEMMRGQKEGASWNVRDRSMAQNIQWILQREGPAARMVVWAHNSHVERESNAGWPAMGSYLASMFPGNTFVFGFAFGEGAFQARDATQGAKSTKQIAEFKVGLAPIGTLEFALEKAGAPIVALDLKHLPEKSALKEWMSARHPSRSVGSMFTSEPSMLQMSAPARAYDALIYVQKTTPVRPIRSSSPPGK